jgi:hypothetical protein
MPILPASTVQSTAQSDRDAFASPVADEKEDESETSKDADNKA